MNINPKFDFKLFNQPGLNDAETIKEGVVKLVKTINPILHSEILKQLLDQIEPIDFIALVYPEIKKMKEKLSQLPSDSKEAANIRKELRQKKVTLKHLLILSVENIIRFAEKNRWGLCKKHELIYLYNGTFWSELDNDVFQKFLGNAAEQLGVQKFDARFFRFREHLFKQFIATALLPAPEANNGVVLINLKNGTFEVSPDGTKL